MKIFKLLILVLSTMLCLNSWAAAGPVAEVQTPVYKFEAVPEGTHIYHEFVVKNKGDQELEIENVLPP